MKMWILAAFAVVGLGLSVGNAAPVGNHSNAWSSGTNFVGGGAG
jgi:hypothetical protein